jgi:hypothetical protein
MINRIFLMEREDGVRLFLTYSDEGVYIYPENKPNSLYLEAIDVESRLVTYKESDKKIEHNSPPK